MSRKNVDNTQPFEAPRFRTAGKAAVGYLRVAGECFAVVGTGFELMGTFSFLFSPLHA